MPDPECVRGNVLARMYHYVWHLNLVNRIDEYQTGMELETLHVGIDGRLNLFYDRRLCIVVVPNEELHGAPKSSVYVD